MANQSPSKSKSLISSLTGHIASWVTGNTGLSRQAAQTMKNRQSAIDSAVENAINSKPKSQSKSKPVNGKWPWQSQ